MVRGMPQLTFVLGPRDVFPLHWVLRSEDAAFVIDIWSQEVVEPWSFKLKDFSLL